MLEEIKIENMIFEVRGKQVIFDSEISVVKCHYYLYDIESCMKYLSKIWEISNNRFEEDYLSDRRFKQMFSGIEILLKKNYDK